MASDDAHRPYAMQPLISLIIPNRNWRWRRCACCLRAALRSRYPRFAVIVVDDASTDDLGGGHPPVPAAAALQSSNATAARRGRATSAPPTPSRADPVLHRRRLPVEENALARAAATLARAGPGPWSAAPIPGRRPTSGSSAASSRCSSTTARRGSESDYLATHALAIRAVDFRRSGGFREDFLPILEDVEFSHRLRRRTATGWS